MGGTKMNTLEKQMMITQILTDNGWDVIDISMTGRCEIRANKRWSNISIYTEECMCHGGRMWINEEHTKTNYEISHPVYDESLGTSLTTLILGDTTERNNSISSISGLKQATKLEKLDVRNLKALNSLDLSNQLYLKELLASNSELNSVTLAKGCPLNKISVPATMTNISFEQLPELTYNNITFELGSRPD